MPIITLGPLDLNYQVTYTTRLKTVSFHLSTPRTLEIAAPRRTSLPEIEKMIKQKSRWLVAQSARLAALEENPVNKNIAHQASILYQGASHRLLLQAGNIAQPSVEHQSGHIIITLPVSASQADTALIAACLKKWYVNKASSLLAAKTAFWALKIGVEPAHISIKDQKTRWGSCSSRGAIHYNWRLIMAPPPVLDYLVIHELAHMLVPNHSPSFWSLVACHLPTYRQHRQWLKDNGRLLHGIL